MNSIKDMVSNNKQVKFTHFKLNELWYETECGFQFPVPVADIGDATFLNQDKAILFMRYIRKHQESLIIAKVVQQIAAGDYEQVEIDDDDNLIEVPKTLHLQ